MSIISQLGTLLEELEMHDFVQAVYKKGYSIAVNSQDQRNCILYTGRLGRSLQGDAGQDWRDLHSQLLSKCYYYDILKDSYNNAPPPPNREIDKLKQQVSVFLSSK
jgi:hypothetical protein